MKTPQEIANEAIEKLGDVTCYEPRYARTLITDALLAAIHRDRAQRLLPGGLSEERMAEIESKRNTPGALGHTAACELLNHVAFLHSIMADDVPTAIVRAEREAGRREGFREGAEAQRSLLATRVKGEPGEKRPMNCWRDGVAEWYVAHVESAPLALPPAKES